MQSKGWWWIVSTLVACGGGAERGQAKPATGVSIATTPAGGAGGAGARSADVASVTSSGGASATRAAAGNPSLGNNSTAGSTVPASSAAGAAAVSGAASSPGANRSPAAAAAGSGGAPSASPAGSPAGAAGGGPVTTVGTPATGAAGGGACGLSPKSGRCDESVMLAGVQRTFIYYAPAGLDPQTPVPVVIAAHGFAMTGEMMFYITGYTQLADREKFVVLFPDGDPNSAGPWNVGDGICGLGSFVAGLGDDQAFVDAMLKHVEGDRLIDRGHIFMTGFSMGGYFSNETGCLRTEIRAIAPHSGGTHDLGHCASKKKPVIIHHFVEDSLIGYDCGVDARDRWVALNGCSAATPEIKNVKGGRCEYYRGCPSDGQVAFCSYNVPPDGGGELVGGHAWSGGAQNVPSGGSFAIPGTDSATELSWAFWKKYAW